MRRLALLFLLALCLVPSLLRRLPAPAPRRCVVGGRGAMPRTWLGCASDPGPSRDLLGDERLLLGLPVDLNRASSRELAFVPGITPALSVEVVAERERGGGFGTVEELERVRGIGPKRLARARPFLSVEPAPVGVADGAEQR